MKQKNLQQIYWAEQRRYKKPCHLTTPASLITAEASPLFLQQLGLWKCSAHWRMSPPPPWGSMWSGSGSRGNSEKLKGMSPLGMSQQLLPSWPLRLEPCQKHTLRGPGDVYGITTASHCHLDLSLQTKERPSIRCWSGDAAVKVFLWLN